MRSRIVLCFAGLMAASPAAAHIGLAEPQAPAGAYHVARFRVGHGCDGAATTEVQIYIPDSVSGARPMPKPGWTLKIDTVKLDKPQAGEGGRPVTERVSVITWAGGSLPNDQFDEFPVLMRLPAKPATLMFPVMQSCGAAMVHWMDAPDGKSRFPAPVLKVGNASAAPMAGAHHEH